MKKTMEGLSDYLGKTKSSLYAMLKTNPIQFKLIWIGYLNSCGVSVEAEQYNKLSAEELFRTTKDFYNNKSD